MGHLPNQKRRGDSSTRQNVRANETVRGTLMKVLLIVFGCAAIAAAQPQPTKVPDTPAGTALQVWLEAFNAADAARLQAYHIKYGKGPADSVDETLVFRRRTGGFQLLEVVQGDSGRLAFRVKELASPTLAVGKIEMTTDAPPVVKRFVLLSVPPDVAANAMLLRLDPATRSRVIDGAITAINEYYIFSELAQKVEAHLRAREQAGAYNDADADSFAALMTKDLQDLTRDKHLRVNFFA